MTEADVDIIKVYQCSQNLAVVTGIMGPVPEGKDQQCYDLVRKQNLSRDEFVATYKDACSLIKRFADRLTAIGAIATLNDSIAKNFSDMADIVKEPVEAYEQAE